MRVAYLICSLMLLFSGCTPGAFNRSSGVPLETGKMYRLEMSFRAGFDVNPPPLDFRVNTVSQPPQNGSRPNSYVVGPYEISFAKQVSGLEWFDGLINGERLIFVAAKLDGKNYFSIIMQRSALAYVTSCDFADWNFGDTTFAGSLLWRGKDGLALNPTQVGQCALTAR